MTEERDRGRDEERRDDELKAPEERVEDLEPDEDESGDVKGGRASSYKEDG